jgi:hypothetical protein
MNARYVHEKFSLPPSCSDARTSNYFRAEREQFDYVHNLIESHILVEACNAQKPTENKKKRPTQYINQGDRL